MKVRITYEYDPGVDSGHTTRPFWAIGGGKARAGASWTEARADLIEAIRACIVAVPAPEEVEIEP